MASDHTGLVALERALLRRQALRVVMLELKPPRSEPVSLWLVAPHLPGWLPQAHRVTSCGPGCYRIEAGAVEVLWVAANELPLHEALLPFLVARSGKKLLELMRWVLSKRPAAWAARLLQWGSMSPELRQQLEAELKVYNLKAETPEEQAAADFAVKVFLKMSPRIADELRAEGEARGEQARLAAEQKAKQAAEQQAQQAARAAIEDMCELLGLPLDEGRQTRLATATTEELVALRATLKATRRWPGS